MTTRWVSGTKTWCEDCQKFFYDNAVGRKKHLASLWHQQCRQKRISEMSKQDKEAKILADQVSREMQFLESKARAQSNADYRAHRSANSVADQYSTYRPEGYSEYAMTSGSAGQHGGGGGMVNDTNYYDDDFLELQRQKLYGVSAEDAEKFRQEEVDKLLGKKTEADEEGGDKEGEDEGDEAEPQGEDEGAEGQPPPPSTPPPPPEGYDPAVETAQTEEDRRKEQQRLTEQRKTEGVAGRYEVVSASAMLGSYRAPEPTPEPAEEGGDGEEEAAPAPKSAIQINIPTSAASLKRKRGELEEEDLWAADLLEGKSADYHGAAIAPKKEKAADVDAPTGGVFREREPEKPLFQTIEDELDDGPVEFKKRRIGNQNSRKKK